MRGTAAAEALRRGHAALTDPVARGLAAVMLARTLLFMENPGEAMEVVDAARAELPADQVDLDLALRAIRIVGVFFGVADPVDARRARGLARAARAARARGRRR